MIRLVILDLDNTLYNWVDYYVPAFRAMVRELAKITGVSESALCLSFKKVHQKHRTSEYAFAIEELDVLKPMTAGKAVPEILEMYRDAIDAFRACRAVTLKLYPGVRSTLGHLRREGRTIVAHTDAMMFYAAYRLKQLGIEHFFDGLVAPKDHGLPRDVLPEWVRSHKDPDRYRANVKYVRELEPSLLKPDPAIVRQIIHEFRAQPDETLYVGDSLRKDVYMAQQAGVHAVLAEYGQFYDPENYRKLVEITHWTDDDVQQEAALRRVSVDQSFFRISRFAEVLGVIREIESNAPSRAATRWRDSASG